MSNDFSFHSDNICEWITLAHLWPALSALWCRDEEGVNDVISRLLCRNHSSHVHSGHYSIPLPLICSFHYELLGERKIYWLLLPCIHPALSSQPQTSNASAWQHLTDHRALESIKTNCGHLIDDWVMDSEYISKPQSNGKLLPMAPDADHS